MKRYIFIAALLALSGAAVVSCSDNDLQIDGQDRTNETVTVNVKGELGEYESQADTKAALVSNIRVGWSPKDSVYVFDGSTLLGKVYAPATISDDRVAELSGTITAPTGNVLTFVYSNMLSSDPVAESGKITIDMSDQTDKNAFVVYGTAEVSQASVSNLVVPFKFATSALKVSVTNLEPVAQITKAELAGINTACVLTLGADGNVTVDGSTSGTIAKTLTSWTASASGYAFVEMGVPVDAANANRKLTVTQGIDTYSKPILTSAKIEKSKNINSIAELNEDLKNYICFTAVDSCVTIGMVADGEDAPEVHLQYSTDGSSWNELEVSTTIDNDTYEPVFTSPIVLGQGEKVYVRATPGYTNSTFFNADEFESNNFYIKNGADVSGDIMAIVSSDSKLSTISDNCAFGYLFYNTDLVDASNLVLSATSVSDYSYMEMFASCTRLVSAPVIMATTIGAYSFGYMFANCESLIKAPALPAKNLAPSCYSGMFNNCSKLIVAPELAAQIMEESCYSGMFEDCSALSLPPALPSTELANSCYYSMFKGCQNLIVAPELPATIMKDGCYYYMFAESSENSAPRIMEAPELPAETLAKSCYSGMFYGCSDLSQAPELPATTLAESCYSGMFYGCSSLSDAPELPATTLAKSCYSNMFNGCSDLSTAPELPEMTLAESCYSDMFNGCSNLSTAPELPATTLAKSCYSGMFRWCSNLSAAPALPATTLAESCYSDMFNGCSNLSTAPELPATTLAPSCYSHMFKHCTGLSIAPELPATTLAASCYSFMFSYCTSLTTGPVLKAKTLEPSCYTWMFEHCSSLLKVTMLATSVNAENALYNWLFDAGIYSTSELYIDSKLYNENHNVEGYLINPTTPAYQSISITKSAFTIKPYQEPEN